jgi:hypothetical protein
MNPVKTLLLSALLTFTLASCDRERVAPAEEQTNDYLVFGRYAGMCRGEHCIDIFKINKSAKQLFEDTKDSYPRADQPYDGTYERRSQTLYEQVQTLPDQVPAQLLTQPVGIVGQPDFADGGGYYVEVSDNGQRKFWLIDTQKSNIPSYLHPFVDELATKISRLQ